MNQLFTWLLTKDSCPIRCFKKALPKPLRKNVFRLLFFFLLVSILILSHQDLLWAQEKKEGDAITMKVVAVNPSEKDTKTIPVKIYLPSEVTPKDILSVSGLEIEYDSDKSMYYAFNDKVELKPKETKVFEVEVKDVWRVSVTELETLKTQTQIIMTRLQDTEYYDTAKKLEDAIYMSLDVIDKTQSDDTVSRKQHIGIYRNNLKIVEQVKEDIARMEKILVTAGGPQSPEMLADTKIKSDSPTKKMTWIVIFSIALFIVLLTGVLFVTWVRQSRITREELLAAKKSAFPGVKEEKEPKPKDSKPA